MGAQAKALYVIANNHFRGQAFANALQLQAPDPGIEPEAPEELVAAYPDCETCERQTQPSVLTRSPSRRRLLVAVLFALRRGVLLGRFGEQAPSRIFAYLPRGYSFSTWSSQTRASAGLLASINVRPSQ